MPSWNDTLLTLAELSIAVLGFAGLIGVFARRQRLESFSQEFLKLRWLLDYGLFALVASLTPFLVFSSNPTATFGWRVSSTILLVTYIVYFVMHRDVIFKTAALGPIAISSYIGDWMIALVLLGNATGFPFAPNECVFCDTMPWLDNRKDRKEFALYIQWR